MELVSAICLTVAKGENAPALPMPHGTVNTNELYATELWQYF